MIKSKKAKVSIGIIFLIVILIGFAAYYRNTHKQPGAQQMQMQMPAPAVTVAKPVVKDIERYYDFTGNVEATASVDIRARVEGILEEIHYTDGSFVEEGELLFVIQPQEYQAQIDEAAAAVASAQAQLESAEADLERVRKAIESNAVSIEEVSRRRAQKQIAQAQLKEAQAKLKTARINMEYTQIHSPISGKISRRLVDKGNLVGAGEKTLLATVVAVDPVYVSFEMSENILTEYVKVNEIDRSENPNSPVSIAPPTSKEYTHKGTLDYIGNVVSRTTGTINLRATVENKSGLLYPGMFARIRVPGEILEDAVLVEESAIGTNLGGKYVLTVDEKNIVSTTQIEPGQSYGRMRVVKSGIAPGTTYVTRGLQKARPGAEITPVEPGDDNQSGKSSDNEQGSGE